MRGWIVIFLLGLAPCRAVTILAPQDSSVTDADYIAEGSLYPAIGRCVGDSGSFFPNGSGVLIGERWVLTAGHLTSGASSATFEIEGTVYSSARIIIHPDIGPPFDPVIDLALVELEAPVTDVDPVRMWRFGSRDDILGEEATWTGWGFGGDGLTGAILNPDTLALRAFTNVIDGFGDEIGLNPASVYSDFDRPGGTDTVTRLEGNVAPGDSGGGVFVERNGEMVLVGVTSYRAQTDGTQDSDYGDFSGATDLFDLFGWIEEQTGIVPVPEPSSASLYAASLLLLGWSRKRLPPETAGESQKRAAIVRRGAP
jgi:hypothetical protein